MANNRIAGSRGQVLSGAGSPLSEIGSISGFTLDLGRDKYDVTAFGDTNKISVLGLPNYTGTLTGFYDNMDLSLFNIALGIDAVTLRLIPDTDDAEFYFEGLSWVDANVNVPSGGAAVVGGSFVAAGNWGMATGSP